MAAGARDTREPTPPHASHPASGWRAATFDAFRFPTYRIIWTGTIIAFLAFTMSGTAQGVVAFDLTGSNRAVGLVAFGQGIAMLVLNPFGGAIADRFPKRLLILIAQFVIGSTMFAIGLMIVTDVLTIGLLALAGFVVGVMFSFLGPTRTAILTEAVDDGRLGNAMALLQVGNNFARITGPFLATGLIAWSVVGAGGTYFFIAGLFVIIFATFYRVPPSPPKKARETSVLEDIRLGVRHVRENPRLFQLLVSFHLTTVVGISNYVVFPGFAKQTLDAGTQGLGVLLGVQAVGGLVMSVTVASLADSKRAPAFLTAAGFGLGVSLIVLGQMPSLLFACLAMLFVGGSGSAFQTLNNAVAIRITDSEYFGRVISLMFLAWGITSVTSLPMGYLADLLGERTVLSGSGAVLCVVVALLYLWRRGLEAAETRTG